MGDLLIIIGERRFGDRSRDWTHYNFFMTQSLYRVFDFFALARGGGGLTVSYTSYTVHIKNNI